MAENTRIEWADDTVNIAGGCTEQRLINGKMDPACVNCYARLMSVRSEAMAAEAGRPTVYEGVAERTQGHGARWTGVLRWDRELMRQRFAAMRGGRRVFLGSMTDLWHEGHDRGLQVGLAEEIRAIGERPPHKRPIVITLTKRERKLLAFQREHFPEGLPEWVWPGVTAGCQEAADQRVPVLLQVRAHGPRVVSVEPMTGPVDLRFCACETCCSGEHPGECSGCAGWGDHSADDEEQETDALGFVSCEDCGGDGVCPACRGEREGSRIGWVIVGGESGHKARPMHPDWARKLRDQCVAAGVPFLFKQWGEWGPPDITRRHALGALAADSDESSLMERVGKKAAGRELDGRTWDQFPS